MKTRLLHLWDNLTSTYWFLPAAMLAAAVLLAFATLRVDLSWTAPSESAWIYTGGPAGARSLLSTVAGSVITVAGVVFSITIAALVQASSQFGPRLLRNFIRDTGNQVVLGTFVATFIYCILVLRAVRGEESYSFVPNISVTVAVLMSISSIGVLIYFIDHVSRSLQAPQIVGTIGHELERAVAHVFPTGLGQECPDGLIDPQAPAADRSADAAPIPAGRSGYVQAVDREGLLRLTVQHDLRVHLTCRPGDYVVRAAPLMWVEPNRPDDAAAQAALARTFILGIQRTAEQDVEYPVRQLVEVAVRALSPGINDPFTAINCIDWLGAMLTAAARQPLPGPNRYDDAGTLRVVARVTTFAGLTAAAFDQVRQYGRDSVAVTIRLLEAIGNALPQVDRPEHRAVLLAQAEVVHAQSRDAIPADADRADVDCRYHAVLAAAAAMDQRTSGTPPSASISR